MRTIAIFVLSLLVHIGYAQQIEFTKTEHNFGTINEVDGIVTTLFEFTNVSDRPFIINFVTSSCGCTTPEYNKAPVMPKGKGSIKVTYNPASRPGYFSKDITITSDNKKHTDVLIISGTVTPRPQTLEEQFPAQIGELRLSTNSIAFPALDRGTNYSQIIDIYNSSNNPLTVVCPEAGIKSTILKPKEQGQLTYSLNLSANHKLGRMTDSIYLTLNGKKTNLPIRVSAMVVPDFSKLTEQERTSSPYIFLSSQFYHFSTVKQNDDLKYDFRITNKGVRDLIIEDVHLSSDKVSYTLPKRTIKNGESIIMTVKLNPKGVNGRLSESVTLITNDISMPVKDLRVAATVSK